MEGFPAVSAQDFPPELYQLGVIISREGYSLTLVGGAVRDFHLTGSFSQDFDFELRHTFHFVDEEWICSIQRLGRRLKQVYGYVVEELAFHILRVTKEGGKWEAEFSSPRKEIYPNDENQNLGHKNFHPKFSSDLPYKEAFSRRDFTINALGIQWNTPGTDDEFTWVDPFQGNTHLTEKKLAFCGDHFSKDPVRYARAMRFAVKLGFSFSTSLETSLEKMSLEGLTHYYFFQEFFKSNSYQYFDLFFSQKRSFPSRLSELSWLKKLHVYDDGSTLTREKFLLSLILYFPHEPWKQVVLYLGASEKLWLKVAERVHLLVQSNSLWDLSLISYKEFLRKFDGNQYYRTMDFFCERSGFWRDLLCEIDYDKQFAFLEGWPQEKPSLSFVEEFMAKNQLEKRERSKVMAFLFFGGNSS